MIWSDEYTPTVGACWRLQRLPVIGGCVLLLGLVIAGQAVTAQQDTERLKIPLIPTQEIRLTNDGHVKQDPVFVDQGLAVVYSSLEKFNQMMLMKLRLADKREDDNPDSAVKPERLHPAASTTELAASFSTDGKSYAYLRNNGNLHFELVIENRTTGETVRYNPGNGFAGVRNLSFSPTGQGVLFAFPDQDGPQQLRLLSLDGKNVSMLTNSEGLNSCPRYSADGRKIVFASSRDGDFDIFVMNADGSNPVNIRHLPGLQTHPVFSPDGKQVAFTWLNHGNYDIYSMNIDGSHLRRLTDHPETDDYPAWSPDGKSLIWVGERNGRRDLYQKSIGTPDQASKTPDTGAARKPNPNDG